MTRFTQVLTHSWLRQALALLLAGQLSSALSAQGTIESWGLGGASNPVIGDSPTGTQFIQVAAGGAHSLALHLDGSIVSWGWDLAGQISNSPSGTDFIHVAAGSDHSLALRSDGSIVSWGGLEPTLISNTPTGTGFIQLAGGSTNSLALRSDGSIVAWGRDQDGAVTDTPTGTGFVQIDSKWSLCVALRDDGSIVSWGSGIHGAATLTSTNGSFTKVRAGQDYLLALREDGTIALRGVYDFFIGLYLPWQSGFIDVDSGLYYALALTADGEIRYWGSNEFLTHNIPSGGDFAQLSAGNNHAVALRDNGAGSAYCFGDGSGATCPCGANGNEGTGCANSSPAGSAKLRGFGSTLLADSDFRLEVTGAPAGKLGLILRGANQLNAGRGTPVGDGLLCTGGQGARSQVQVASMWGYMAFTDFGGSTFAGTSYGAGIATNYQLWYRDPANTCTGVGFNFSNAWTVTWKP